MTILLMQMLGPNNLEIINEHIRVSKKIELFFFYISTINILMNNFKNSDILVIVDISNQNIAEIYFCSKIYVVGSFIHIKYLKRVSYSQFSNRTVSKIKHYFHNLSKILNFS